MQRTEVSRSTLPDLVEVQRASFCWFLEEGLAEAEPNGIRNLSEILTWRHLAAPSVSDGKE